MSKLVFVWDNFGPLHADRCDAVARKFDGEHEVIGLEVAARSKLYGWAPENGARFKKITLVTGCAMDEIPLTRRFRRILRGCMSIRGKAQFFMCHYDDPAIFAVASLLRLMGRPAYTLGCSKFDDYERKLYRELMKSFVYLPYKGGIASGTRSRDYMRFMGLDAARVQSPYNAVSLDRIRMLAGAPPAPDGSGFGSRHFTIVARLVPKKNVSMALKAMHHYAASAARPRPVHIFGTGPLEGELREEAKSLGIAELVHFHGFCQTAEVSRAYGQSLALLLPSIEEQFGNVVPEAMAMGLPVIVSDNCGARDVLVRSGVNGFVVEPDNPTGMAFFMRLLSEDEALWRRMCLAALERSQHGDSERFAEAVEALIAEPVR
ncbi:MAG TPA: glycosyltransferase [Terracidiphilus sp.]|nr:glycosyltransferase [Terracidiphilus sp.]